MATKSHCTYPDCEKQRDQHDTTTMCREHSARWKRSEDFMNATKDPGIRAAMGMGARETAMRALAKWRRNWANREADAEGT